MQILSLRAPLWLGALLLLLPMASMAQTTKPTDLTARMWQSLPPGQAIVVSLRLSHWKHMRKTAMGLLATKPGATPSQMHKMLVSMLAPQDPKVALMQFMMVGKMVKSPQQAKKVAKHLDTRHPIFYSLFSTDLSKTRQALQIGLFDLKKPERGATPLSTQAETITIPSTNPGALIAALSQTRLLRGKGKLWPEGQKLLGWSGAQIYKHRGRLFAMVPRKGFVQIMETKPLPKLSFTKKQRWELLQIKHIGKLLTHKNSRRMTRARAHFLQASSLLALYGHGANILRWGSLQGLLNAYQALPHATPDQRRQLLSQYYSIAMSGRFLMSSPAAEIEDTAITLSLKQGLQLQAVSSLTQSGQRAYKAALKGAATTIATKSKQPLFSFAFDGNLKRLMASFKQPLPWVTAAPVTQLNANARSYFHSIPYVFKSCGISCQLNLWSGGYWYALKGFLSAMKKDRRVTFRSFIPRRVKIVFPKLNASPKRPPQPTMAVALLTHKLTPAAKKAFAKSNQLMLRTGWKLTFQPAADGGTCILLAVGVDATKIFGSCRLAKVSKQQPRAIHRMRLDLARVRAALLGMIRQFAQSGRPLPGALVFVISTGLLAKLKQLRGRTYITKKARVIQLQLVTDTTPKSWPTLPKVTGVAAPIPMPTPWPYQGPKMCQVRLQQLHMELAKTIDSGTQDQKRKFIRTWWKRAQPNIACLGKDKTLSKLIAPIRAMWQRALQLAK